MQIKNNLSLLFILFTWALGLNSASASLQTSQPGESSSPELILQGDSVESTSAILLDTHISGQVDGLVASITIIQTYRNPADEWVNGRYVIPLPENAAIHKMIMKTDGRVIEGVVKEKQTAKKIFEAAKKEGKKAGLLQQSRANLFSMSLANIAPGSEISTELTWVQTIEYDAGQFSLRLPTTLTPRFIPGHKILQTDTESFFQPEDINEEDMDLTFSGMQGWALPTDQVPDAEEITPFQVSSIENSHSFTLDLQINSGIAIDGFSSVTHQLLVESIEEQTNQYRVSLGQQSEKLNRDLVLHWSPQASHAPVAAMLSEPIENDFYTLTMVMPPVQNIIQTLPRDILFIIDSSGSMAGVSMLQARKGLKSALALLSSNDRFNVIDFDSGAVSLFPVPMPASQDNRIVANRFVDGLVADGGTNMEGALNLAFSQTGSQDRLQQIIFITDGSIGNEQALFKLIESRIGQSRLFTVGIGSAPNTHFMRGAALHGRGTYVQVDSIAEASSTLTELFEKINRPVMRDISVEWLDSQGNVIQTDAYPKKITDLYAGEPITVLSRSDNPVASINVQGQISGATWRREIKNPGLAKASNLSKVWARQKVDYLESQQTINGQSIDAIKQDIVKLGVDHQLVTRFTSFIAVDKTPTKPADQVAKDKNIPNLMPKGNAMAIPTPNTATPATLLSIMGLVLIFLSRLSWIRAVITRPRGSSKYLLSH